MPTYTHPLSKDETRLAEASSKALRRLFSKENASLPKATLRVRIEQPEGEISDIRLPDATLPLISTILRALGQGKQPVVLTSETEVTTQQAADFLNVSRPYFVKLLEQGKIPFRRVGPRRRVRLGDLLRYQEQEEENRHRGLDELVAEAQKLGMYGC